MSGSDAVLAVDVGGSLVKGWVVDRSGRVLLAQERATPVAEGAEAVLAAIRGLAVQLAGRQSVCGAGLVVPGVVDESSGIARYSANLGWRDVPLRQALADQLGVPVALGHDVAAAGLAERTVGAVREVTDALVVVIGTGIAAVLLCGGRAVRGSQGVAGELGHVTVAVDGDPCGCGRQGCLEAYASAAAIARRYRRISGTPLRTPEVIGAVATDPVAKQVWQEAVDALAAALADATMLLDPEVVVLGGGLAEAGELLVAPVRDALAARLGWHPVPRVVGSTLGSRAGRAGAAILAWRAAGLTDFHAWVDAGALQP